MEIRTAKKEDCEQIAIIHKKGLADHFIGMLSIELIKRFYESFISEQTLFLVSVDENRVFGFLLGGDGYQMQKIKQKFVRQNLLNLFVYILFSPKLYPLVLRRLKIKKKNKAAVIEPSSCSFRSLSLGVDPNKSGVAFALFKAFDKMAKQAGIERYGCSVLKTNNASILFHEKIGFKREKETTGSVYFYKILKQPISKT